MTFITTYSLKHCIQQRIATKIAVDQVNPAIHEGILNNALWFMLELSLCKVNVVVTSISQGLRQSTQTDGSSPSFLIRLFFLTSLSYA